MLDVIFLEGDGVRDGERKVSEDTQHLVSEWPVVAKGEVVGDLVDGKRQGMVEDATEAVAGEQDKADGGFSEKPGCQKLHYNHTQHSPF